MARQFANVDIQVDTFGSWISRTNQLLESFSSEVLTANSTSGVTGSTTNKRNATLYGNFNTNTVYVADSFKVGTGISANTTTFTFGPAIKVIADSQVGLTGQILTMGTTGLKWTYAGSGTVTKVTGGNGLSGGDITSTGTLTVKPSSGITVGAAGVAVDAAYIATLDSGNAAKLQTYTWASPGKIGSTVANTGTFTTATATSYSITGDTFFTFTGSQLSTRGYIDSTTPATGTIGGVNLRASNGGTTARLRVTDFAATTTYGTATINNSGLWSWSGAGGISTTGDLTAASASLTGNLTVSTGNASGGGITLSDAGDIADLNDGYASMRFTNGVKIYSANKGGTPAITLNSTGTAFLGANKVLTLADFDADTSMSISLSPYNTGYTSYGGWTKLPNGIIIQWGQLGNANATPNGSSFNFPIAFPHACLSLVGSVASPNAQYGKQNNPTFWITSTSTFGASSWDASPIPHMFIAIGY